MTDHSTRTGLKWGIVGGVVAAVFLPATIVAGAVALGAAGAAAGKARNLSHRLDVENELAGVITPGTSGILALVTAADATPSRRRCLTPKRSRPSRSTRRPPARSRKPRPRPKRSPRRGTDAARRVPAHMTPIEPGPFGDRARCLRPVRSGQGLGGPSVARRRQGTTPSISMSSEKLRKVRTSTISPSVAAFSRV